MQVEAALELRPGTRGRPAHEDQGSGSPVLLVPFGSQGGKEEHAGNQAKPRRDRDEGEEQAQRVNAHSVQHPGRLGMSRTSSSSGQPRDLHHEEHEVEGEEGADGEAPALIEIAQERPE